MRSPRVLLRKSAPSVFRFLRRSGLEQGHREATTDEAGPQKPLFLEAFFRYEFRRVVCPFRRVPGYQICASWPRGRGAPVAAKYSLPLSPIANSVVSPTQR